jgi:hypothetical protein
MEKIELIENEIYTSLNGNIVKLDHFFTDLAIRGKFIGGNRDCF